MFALFRSPSDCQFIDRGLVRCPLRAADVELDVCAACRWRLEIDEKGKLPSVRCRPQVTRAPARLVG
jgi:hypothetical protein